MFIFEVHGKPIPQDQTAFACSCPPTRKCKKWGYNPNKTDIERLQWQVRPFAPAEPLSGPIELTLTFFLAIPKSTSGIRRRQMLNRQILPITKPDQDNLAYLVTNALKNIVYKDDNQICISHVYKYYGNEPKTVIKVRPIQTGEQLDAHDL